MRRLGTHVVIGAIIIIPNVDVIIAIVIIIMVEVCQGMLMNLHCMANELRHTHTLKHTRENAGEKNEKRKAKNFPRRVVQIYSILDVDNFVNLIFHATQKGPTDMQGGTWGREGGRGVFVVVCPI